MEYKIIHGRKYHIEPEINQALKEGWKLHGSVAISAKHGTPHYDPEFAQAMIKDTEGGGG